MSVRSVFSLERWKSRLKSAWSYDPADRAYLVVLIGLVATMLGFYYLSLSANAYETVMIPRLTIYASLILLAGALLNTFFNVSEMIIPDEEEQEEDELFSSETSLTFDLSYTMLARKTGAIVLYFLGVYYVGFFTVSTLFTFIYVLLNTDERGVRRLIRAVLIAVLVVGLLWTIFVFSLGMIQIYRLGPLP